MFASKDLFLTRPSGYQISRSVRLRSSASAYFTRTPATATNQRTWSWSAWVKRGALGTEQMLFEGGIYSGSTEQLRVFFTSTDNLEFNEFSSSAYQFRYVTTAVYRDPSAWYHILAVLDTTNSIGKLYVNGVQVTAFSTSTAPALNFQGKVNSVVAHDIGRRNGTGTPYFDGYLTEINFIDGQALTPSSFGQTNTVTGVWQPIKYTGTYGTNGFYLNFSDNSNNTATTIGKDYSGNGNNWTPNNISVTAGTTYDSMLDVPTLYADGGNGRGNYPVWNPLTSGGLVTFTEANLKALSTSASAPYNIESTIKTATTGKWYAEVTMAAGASSPAVGIGNNPSASSSNTDQWAAYRVNGTYITSGMGASSTGTPATFTTNDVIGIAYDADAGTLSFYKNGTLQTGGFTGITAGNYSFVVRKDSASNDGGYLNCGQRPFTYTPPTGFVALNTQNLPTPTISNGATVMAASTYTGTGATQTIANSGNNAGSISFQPDLVWIKSRSAATNNNLFDSVRGTTNYLISNSTAAAATNANTLTAFGTTGFTLGSDASSIGVNVNTATYVAWQWQAGQGSTSSNTSGSITSTVSVNATAGFSIVTYTGTGANATVGHGLGVAPKMVIAKQRTAASTTSWAVYHSSLGATNYVLLNSTNASAALSTVWNNTAPTSNVFSVGSDGAVNATSGTYVAYCFAAVAGYSAFGSYTGNGSADGPFVFTNFRPRWVMIKRTDANENWQMYDTSRNTSNVVGEYLLANSSGAGATITVLDFLSNGFKIRVDGTNPGVNTSGGTYIFAAFSEVGFKYALGR